MLRSRRNAFDPIGLDDESLVLFNACCDLAKSKTIDGESALADAHRAMRDGQPLRAIHCLHAYLTQHKIDLLNPPEINGPRLAQLRKAKQVKAKDLARALNVSTSALSQLEKGRSAISFMRILPASEIIGCDPHQLFVSYTQKTSTARGRRLTTRYG